MSEIHFDGPVVLAILDGVGLSNDAEGNAVLSADTPFLVNATKNYQKTALNASGEAVGILPGVMGNSEVGHNTIGCGQIYKHGSAHIKAAFDDGSIWQSEAWTGAMNILKDTTKTLHFSGIFSDGDVHSNISQLETMIKKAYDEGVRRMRVHAIFDGRDVPPRSEPKFINRLEDFAKQFNDLDLKIADGGGRMVITADRYGNDWGMVERGWNLIWHGISGNKFRTAVEAIETLRAKDPEVQDQYLPDFVIVDENNAPVGTINKGDVFIYYDFRADRAVEIAEAFDAADFDKFNRGDYRANDIFFVGLTEYDTDRHIPKNQLVEPVVIKNTLSEFLSQLGISNLGVSETVKFGHVSYYFNGNSHADLPGEKLIEIPSDTLPFDSRPWMKAAEITDAVLDNLKDFKFVRVNYPNGDMVGHFAKMQPTVQAMEAIDLSLARLANALDELGGCLIITADHGNAEELLDENGEPKTSHTTNPVPFVIYDNTENRNKYQIANIPDAGLSNIAATMAVLLGQDDFPEAWKAPLITKK